ncbi:MAG: hypothetical protein V1900_02240 [Candidatus Aenigmatarchaeota archaeon]
MNAKGVSPLIASVLLIAISVMIAYVIMSWSTTLTKEQTKSISNKTTEQVECGLIQIKDVYMDLTNNNNISRVYIWSTNAIDYIVSASMMNKNGELANNLTVLPMNITKGELKVFLFNLSGKINSCANFSQVVITTKCTTETFTGTPKC